MRKLIAVIAAAFTLAALALPVAADQANSDSDLVTVGDQSAVALATTPGQTVTFQLRLSIACNSSQHMGPSVTLSPSYELVPAGGALSAPAVLINRPVIWPADGSSCGATAPALSSPVTVSVTAPSAAVASPVTHTYKLLWTSNDGDVSDSPGQVRTTITLTVNPAVTDTTPPVLTPTVSGTLGTNGWYTSNVSVSWAVTDPQSAVVVDSGCGTQNFTTDTAAALSSCTAHSAGGSATASVPLKIDKTGPTATLSPSGTLGSGGWYVSDVSVTTTGTDSISGPVTCTPLQPFTNETTGTTVNGSCTNGAGLTTAATALLLRIDKTGPTATVAVTAGTGGTNGWYTTDVTVSTTGSDPISDGVTCSAPQTLVTETTGTAVNGSCTNAAGLSTSAAPITVKIDTTEPSANLVVTEGDLGDDGWYTSAVTVSTVGADTVAEPVDCTADQALGDDTPAAEVIGSCTNDAGLTEHAPPLTVKIDTTAPTAALVVTAGTAGANGWYTSDVTVHVVGDDPTSGVTCSEDVIVDADTEGIHVTGYCINGAGTRTDAAPLTIKLDTTGPSATLAVTTGTLGANGWYTSNVTIATTGADGISGPVVCTDDQFQTTETTGNPFNGQCTNGAGLSTAATALTIKLDTTGPSATLAVTTGTLGANGWYTSNVTIATTGADGISGPVVCTDDQFQTTETTGNPFNGQCTNGAGLSTAATALTIKLDTTGPSATLAVTTGTLGANGWYTSNVTIATTGADGISGPVVCTDDQFQTTETTGNPFNGQCTNGAGLSTAATALTIKLDTTGPSATLAVTTGTLGANGWYTSNVTVTASGDDDIALPVSCTAETVLTTDTPGTDVHGSCTNDAGLTTEADALTIQLDTTDPSATLTIVSGTLGANGWYISPVTVHASGGDNVSDPVTCDPEDQTQADDTTGRTFEATCTNDAGRSQTAAPVIVKVDTTPPTAQLVVTDGTVGANGWYTSAVTVHVTGADPTSGVDCTADVIVSVETPGTPVTGSCTNGAGLTTEADPITIKLDTSGPSASLAVTAGTPGANGWYTTDVTVSTSGIDDVSGGVVCTVDQHQTTETAGTPFSGSCTNAAGLSTNAAPLVVKLDKTGPTASLAVTSGTLGSADWYVSNVTMSTTGADSVSSPVACTADQLLLVDTPGTTFHGSCTNDAGLTTAAADLVVKRDATAPTVTVTGVNPVYTLGDAITPGCTTTDATSGVAAHATPTVTGGNANGVGTFTVTCSGGRDVASNTASAVTTYRVLYRWDGFLQPINDTAHQIGTATSVFRAGSTVPVKFQLRRADGSLVQPLSAPLWITPVRGAPMTAPVDETVYGDVATSGTTYRGEGNQWIYNWGTARSGAGYYWRIGVRLDDGQTYFVNIGLR